MIYNQNNDVRNGGGLRLFQCANITVRNMTLPNKNPSILLDVVAVDHAAQTVKIKPQRAKEPTCTRSSRPKKPRNSALPRFKKFRKGSQLHP